MLLIRISLVLAILAGIGAAVLGFVQLKPAIETLKQNYADEQDAHKKTKGEKAKAEKELAATKESLDKEKTDHGRTKSQLAASDKAKSEAQKEVAKLKNDVSDAEGRATAAKQELSAWGALGIPVDKIKDELEAKKVALAKVDDLEKIRESLTNKVNSLQAFIETLISKEDTNDFGPTMMGPIKGKVVVVDPKWQFVVLDVGSKNNIVQNGILKVGRDGKLIARVRITRVMEDSCVAFVMKGWNLTDIREGDIVLY